MTAPMDLHVQGLSWSPGRQNAPLLYPTNFSLNAGKILGIVGPNGAGKTTLLRLLYRFYRPTTGTIMIGGSNIWNLSARQTAQRVAAVLQEQPSDLALTVFDLVALGRTPHHRGLGGSVSPQDRQIIDEILTRLVLDPLAHRHLSTLSGGERQRVMVARALAQQPSVLILDEPTNHLDIRHQLEVLDLIQDLPLTIIISLHDLNLAARVCDAILLLQAGHSLAFGAPAEVLSEAKVSQAFAVQAQRERLSLSQSDHLTFHL